jgi:polyisoprenoid-binding protein YceI
MKNVIACLILSGLLAATTPATAEHYIIDPVHSQVLFSVSHLGFSSSHGAFVEFDGTFEFDESDVENSSVEVTIQTNSINMNDASWNSHLTGAKWFFSPKFPTMTFTSTGVTSTGENTMDIEGVLTLLDEPIPVTLNATINKVGDNMGTHTAGFSATTTIDRTQFGMETFAGFIGNEVSIHLEVEGSPPEEE